VGTLLLVAVLPHMPTPDLASRNPSRITCIPPRGIPAVLTPLQKLATPLCTVLGGLYRLHTASPHSSVPTRVHVRPSSGVIPTHDVASPTHGQR